MTKMSYPICNFLIIFVFINFINFDITLSKCHDVPGMENVQFKKLNGLWYPAETTDPSVRARKGCDAFNLTYSNSENGEAITAFLISDQKNYEIYKSYPVNGTGRLKVQRNGNRRIAGLLDGFLISTDYDNYSMWYLCEENSNDLGYKYIGLRERPPKKEIVKKIRNMFKSFGFDLKDLRGINQSNC